MLQPSVHILKLDTRISTRCEPYSSLVKLITLFGIAPEKPEVVFKAQKLLLGVFEQFSRSASGLQKSF